MAIGTLAELLSPAAEAEFTEKLHRRELAIWQGRDPVRLAPLLDWPALMSALEAGAIPARRLRMTRGGGAAIHEAFFTKDGQIDGTRVRALMEEGASLILQPFDGTVPSVDALVAHIQSRTRDRVESGVIVTTGAGGALRQHYDPDDLLIVQLEGSKRWFVRETPVAHPVRKMPPAEAPREGRIVEHTLKPGDLLLVPAGYWHHCENIEGRSMHLGLFFVPLSLTVAAERLWRRLLSDERARAPLARDGRAPDEADIRSKLIDAISRMSLEDFFRGRD